MHSDEHSDEHSEERRDEPAPKRQAKLNRSSPFYDPELNPLGKEIYKPTKLTRKQRQRLDIPLPTQPKPKFYKLHVQTRYEGGDWAT